MSMETGAFPFGKEELWVLLLFVMPIGGALPSRDVRKLLYAVCCEAK